MLLSMKHLNVMGDRKLVPCFVGPFSIAELVGPLVYWLNLGNCYSQLHSIFHVSLTKPFRAGSDGYLYPRAVYVEDKQEWEVSGLLRHKRSGGSRKHLVAYSGYNKSKAFW